MKGRQRSWPRVWLMTDERAGDRQWSAIERLPTNAGIVFRHYSLDPSVRRELVLSVARLARERGLMLAVGADPELAAEVRADLIHNPVGATGDMPFSRSVHSLSQAAAAKSEGAALAFISPVHATRSHPRQTPLGIDRAVEIAKAAGVPAIALGGMNEQKFAPLKRAGFYGWAAIDAWIEIRT